MRQAINQIGGDSFWGCVPSERDGCGGGNEKAGLHGGTPERRGG